ncbi:hypothetical protein ACFVTF_26400 [Kitasatospora sp. NPDC057940]|uniref:hypothetical protein n=1 Tax=Kitasatospora sp. NPDC057940 TaxID=3346285 RepID=UPI0036DE34CE
MSGRWKYEVLACTADSPDHGDSCSLWTLVDTYYGQAFTKAFEAAAVKVHAQVRTVSPFNGNSVLSFHHIEGGGLCEWCGPATGRRGPWMRTPNENRFMCPSCVADGEAAMDVLHGDNGWPWSRSYWPVLEEAGD